MVKDDGELVSIDHLSGLKKTMVTFFSVNLGLIPMPLFLGKIRHVHHLRLQEYGFEVKTYSLYVRANHRYWNVPCVMRNAFASFEFNVSNVR